MPHIHFYLPEKLAELLGRDIIPIPCPYFVERLIPNGIWRLSFDS